VTYVLEEIQFRWCIEESSHTVHHLLQLIIHLVLLTHGINQ
jgi:hypothetical protein